MPVATAAAMPASMPELPPDGSGESSGSPRRSGSSETPPTGGGGVDVGGTTVGVGGAVIAAIAVWESPGAILGVLRKDFTKQVVRRLYDDLRNRFDTIIVDAGPVRSDFDACLIAAEADQVVMIVDRNQDRDQVRAAASRLGQLGIDTAGLLFNGALVSDGRSVDVSDFGTVTADGSSAGAHGSSRAASDRQRAA